MREGDPSPEEMGLKPHEYGAFTPKDEFGLRRLERESLGSNKMGEELKIWGKKFRVGDFGTYHVNGKEINNLQVMGAVRDEEGNPTAIKVMEAQGTNAFTIPLDSLENFTVTLANRNTEQEEQDIVDERVNRLIKKEYPDTSREAAA